MDDSGFGIYSFYFKLVRTFGSFPYRVEGTGTKVREQDKPTFLIRCYLKCIMERLDTTEVVSGNGCIT